MGKFFKNVKRLKLKITSIFMVVLLLTLEFSPFAVKAAAEKLQFYSPGSVSVGYDSYNNKNVFYGNATLGGITAYCLDYTCPLPSGTMTFTRYLSDQAMAVLINGYPYRKAADMGLPDEEEAYMATQMAFWEVVNRTGESHKAGRVFRVANITPKAGMEGFFQRTTAAAAKLVSLAESSPFSEVPTLVVNTESVKLSNIGTDALVGPYYVRIDGIKTSTIESLTASLSGAPSSARITDASGNNKTTINSGDAVYVRFSGKEPSVSFKVNFHSDVNKVCGRVYEKNGDVQDYCIVDRVPVEMNQSVTISWEEVEEYGQIRLTKVDQDDQPVAGAKFKLINADSGEVMVEEVETGDSGVLTFYKLPKGNYKLIEIEAPYGYEVVESTKNVQVESGKMTDVKMTNNRITGRIVVTKVDDANKPLANVTFEIYDYQGNPIQQIVTNEKGEASANVGYGTYYFKEIKCPEGYIMDETVYRFKVDQENRTFYKTVTNDRYTGSIIIVKKDDANQPIKGVKFDILDEEGNVVISLTTNKDGKCGAGGLKMGTYYYQETYAPPEYKMDTTKHEFKLSQNNEVIERTVVNETLPLSIKIIKVDDDNKPIKNAKFNILDANKQVVDTIVTDENGEATSKELAPGKYYYKEVEVPSPYILDSTEYEVSLQAGGKVVTKTVVNHTAHGKLKINKYDTNQTSLAGVKFNILDEEGNIVDTIVTNANGEATSKDLVLGKYYYQEVEAPDNVIMDTEKHEFVLSENNQVVEKNVINEVKEYGQLRINKYTKDGKTLAGVKFNILDENKQVVDTIVTDENGVATTKELPLGKYYYQEVEAPDNVVMDTDLHEFELTDNGKIVTKTVVNETLEYGSLRINKYASDGRTLAGVKFNILDENKQVVDTIVTDENGYAQSKELLVGTYYYQEVEAPDNVVMDTELHEFKLTGNGNIVTKTVVNELVEGKLHIIKKDESDNPVPGVKFEIYDEDMNLVTTMVTDENGDAISEDIPKGTYYYKEVEAPNNLVMDQELHKFTIETDGQNVIETVINNFVKGKIRILKLEDGTTTPLAGAKFAILDANKNIIQEIVTDENGIAESDYLLYGTYTFKEIEPPSKYVLDPTEHEFTIDGDGDVIESIVYNTKTRLPQTGGLIGDNMMIVIIVSVVSIAGYAFLKLISAKKDNNE